MSLELHLTVANPFGYIRTSVGEYNRYGVYYSALALGWESCRESTETLIFDRPFLKNNTDRMLGFVFNRHSYGIKTDLECKWNIARWFHALEEKMGWYDRTRVHDTPDSNTVIVYFSGGWWQSKTAISLSTLMLRVAPYFYEGRNFDNMINTNDYLNRTRNGFYRFIEGNHFPLLDRGNWVSSYYNLDWDAVCKKLIKKESVEALAKQKWEEAGCPSDKDKLFWELACCELRERETQNV